MADLGIASMNVRGIGNNNKRRETFNWLRNKQQSIIFWQEAHCTEKILTIGNLNGATKHFLVAVQAAQRASVFSLTTILTLIF